MQMAMSIQCFMLQTDSFQICERLAQHVIRTSFLKKIAFVSVIFEILVQINLNFIYRSTLTAMFVNITRSFQNTSVIDKRFIRTKLSVQVMI